MLSMTASRGGDLPLGEDDVLLTPRPPTGVRFTDWERHTETFQSAYRQASSFIAAQIAEGDPRVLSLVNPSE